jgi:hypothetical protein
MKFIHTITKIIEMKNLLKLKLSYILSLLLILTSLILTGCKKDNSNDMIPDNLLDKSYKGSLTVRYANVYPAWDVSTTMDVDVDKVTGLVTISNATLSYSGETLVSADSKIQRSGSWSINPTSELRDNADNPNIYVDAGIVIQNDVQNIYAKDNSGNWQLVNSTDFSGETPESELSFNLKNATISGSTITASGAGGSIIWTMILTPALD